MKNSPTSFIAFESKQLYSKNVDENSPSSKDIESHPKVVSWGP